MSETVLALVITVIILATLFAWVPLLHVAAYLTRRNARVLAERKVQSPAAVSSEFPASYESKVA